MVAVTGPGTGWAWGQNGDGYRGQGETGWCGDGGQRGQDRDGDRMGMGPGARLPQLPAGPAEAAQRAGNKCGDKPGIIPQPEQSQNPQSASHQQFVLSQEIR